MTPLYFPVPMTLNNWTQKVDGVKCPCQGNRRKKVLMLNINILLRKKNILCLAQYVPTFYWQTLHSFSEDQPN